MVNVMVKEMIELDETTKPEVDHKLYMRLVQAIRAATDKKVPDIIITQAALAALGPITIYTQHPPRKHASAQSTESA